MISFISGLTDCCRRLMIGKFNTRTANTLYKYYCQCPGFQRTWYFYCNQAVTLHNVHMSLPVMLTLSWWNFMTNTNTLCFLVWAKEKRSTSHPHSVAARNARPFMLKSSTMQWKRLYPLKHKTHHSLFWNLMLN